MIWHDIIATAIHSPSPHNCQPWLVKLRSETEAELYIDSKRTLPKEDVTGSFIILTMGIFLEALSILAKPRGFSLEYEFFHPPGWYAPAIIETKNAWQIPFAKMKLVPTSAAGTAGVEQPAYNENLFLKRRTSRLPLLEKPVPEEALEKLKNIASNFGRNFSCLTDKAAIEKVMAYNTEALFEDLNSPDYHDEIVEWFRYSDRESEEKLDGLDYRCMNTSPLLYKMSAKMSWMMKTPVLKTLMAKTYRSQLGPIPTLGVCSGKFWDPADAFGAGRFLVNFWLETAAHDLYIHPYGNLVTNRRIAAQVERETGISDVWLIFKIGYSAEPPKSRRLPMESVLIV
jgi:nitroreductase